MQKPRRCAGKRAIFKIWNGQTLSQKQIEAFPISNGMTRGFILPIIALIIVVILLIYVGALPHAFKPFMSGKPIQLIPGAHN